MHSIVKSKVTKKPIKASEEKLSSSYDTARAETNTPHKVREGEEPEAIRQQRLERAKGK